MLTTHSMEEVEVLCSRVGIMHRGRLACLGSPQHLKALYGGALTTRALYSTTGPHSTDKVPVVAEHPMEFKHVGPSLQLGSRRNAGSDSAVQRREREI